MSTKEKSLDQILQESREIHTWTISSLDDILFPVNKRLLLSIAAFDVVLDHFTGITALTENRVYGAAFALVRPLFETFVRAVWLKDCGTDQDLLLFERDEFSRSCGQALREIEQLESFKSGALSNLKRQALAINGLKEVAVLQNPIQINGLKGQKMTVRLSLRLVLGR